MVSGIHKGWFQGVGKFLLSKVNIAKKKTTQLSFKKVYWHSPSKTER